MRPVLLAVTCLLPLGLAQSLPAAEVILKDGRTIFTSKPYVVKGRLAVLTLPDGSVVSLPVDDIDVEKSARTTRVKPPAPAPEQTPAPVKKPLTPAEAAKVKNPRRASVVLTDANVASGPQYSPEGDAVEKKGDGEVSVGSVSATRTKTGYSFVGSVVNTGKGDVRGVSVTIQLIGEGQKSLQTAFGNVAKDNLAPGEKSAFTAEVASETEAKSFKYVPSWQVMVPIKAAQADSAASGPEAAAAAKPTPPPQPQAAPKSEQPEQPPQPPPRPDVAAPQANVSVGAPAAPGGTYLPRPSEGQPK